MRKGGVKLVLITGARLSTMLQRMAFLPAADAYICENGGRIFYPGSSLPLAFPITEDMDWRHKHNAAGMLLLSYNPETVMPCQPSGPCHAAFERGYLHA